MKYISTRGDKVELTASQAILQGLAPDGGLYVPEEIPVIPFDIADIKDMSYRELAFNVMKLLLTDYTEEELSYCVNSAYDEKFDTDVIVPLTYADDTYFIELFHGPTIAFKDMALSILPYLMKTAAKKNGLDKEIVILTATSGDTGKAALEGFSDVEGTKIIVFYPKDGVSKVQELQMLTTEGANTYVVGIKGNFDDAQRGVKELFGDAEMAQALSENGFIFSSANSINIGRLVPQIVYYFYAYATLLREEKINAGDQINVVVPTGNFGNILAAYIGKLMGLPVKQFVCASNDNKVLYDFFKTGTYDRNREFIVTTSPSMDILISSNLERLIYLLTGRNSEKNSGFMKDLSQSGAYTIDAEMIGKMSDICGGFATEAEVSQAIGDLYKKTGYVIDTHTAVAKAVYDEYRKETQDETPVVIASTASPYKFADSVVGAIEEAGSYEYNIEKLQELSGTELPMAVKKLFNAPILHDRVCAPEEMKDTVKAILGIEK